MDELRLCLVTDRKQTRGRELVDVVAACLAAGLPAVQVREKDLPAGELGTLCRRIRALRPSPFLIVNDRADVALAVGADGVQRTHASLSVDELRVVADKRLKVGASVHTVEEAIVAAVEIPVIAIGGITPARVAEVRVAGARGVAVISAILSADDPAAATRAFLDALR